MKRSVMKIKTQKIASFFGSGWVFAGTLAIFITETAWLAVNSRFPMAFDEAYHLGLIQFFGHRLDPIVTSQAAETYKFGALIQNPSLLYHYLMSFPDRFISVFTASPEIHVIGLRFINIALIVAALLVLRKLLQLLEASKPLANLLILAFALTPLVTVVAAQINYDNLLILAVSACMYLAVAFLQQLKQGKFETGKLMGLLCICLFSSLVKFSFLPIFAAVAFFVAWKILATRAKKFSGTNRYIKGLLLAGIVIGGFLFARIYAVNLVKYHNPVPQCDQILRYDDCKRYYAWNNSHLIPGREESHPATGTTLLSFSSYWFAVNTFELFGTVVPLYGRLHASPPYLLIVALLATVMSVFTLLNLKKVLNKAPELGLLLTVVAAYAAVLWAKNYHDYLLTGQPIAIHGRYLLPILAYIYILLAFGFRAAFDGRRGGQAIKAEAALLVAVAFICYGGFYQYVTKVTPAYGKLSPSNDFTLNEAKYH